MAFSFSDLYKGSPAYWLGRGGEGIYNGITGSDAHPVSNAVKDVFKAVDPATPYNTLGDALGSASEQARQLSDLQWQRQMQGLQQAMGHVDHSQSLWNSVYGGSPGGAVSHAPAPVSQMPARQALQNQPGGTRLEDWLNAGKAPTLNEHLQAGQPTLRDTLMGTRPNPAGSSPPPTGGPGPTPIQQFAGPPGFSPPYQPPAPGGGLTRATAPTASSALDTYLGQSMPQTSPQAIQAGGLAEALGLTSTGTLSPIRRATPRLF